MDVTVLKVLEAAVTQHAPGSNLSLEPVTDVGNELLQVDMAQTSSLLVCANWLGERRGRSKSAEAPEGGCVPPGGEGAPLPFWHGVEGATGLGVDSVGSALRRVMCGRTWASRVARDSNAKDTSQWWDYERVVQSCIVKREREKARCFASGRQVGLAALMRCKLPGCVFRKGRELTSGTFCT
eukprot:3415060-Amphidinium_carterae.1